MSQLSKPIFLYCSRLLSTPYLDSFLYYAQILLLENTNLRIFIMSRKISVYQSRFIKKLSEKSNLVVIKSFKFGYALRAFETGLLLDLSIKNLSYLSKENIYSVAWSLVNAIAVTPRTKKSLKAIIPSNFPVQKI